MPKVNTVCAQATWTLAQLCRWNALFSAALIWPPGASGPLFSVVPHSQQAGFFSGLTHRVCVMPGCSERVDFVLCWCRWRSRCARQPALMPLPGACMVHVICVAANDKAKQTSCRPCSLDRDSKGQWCPWDQQLKPGSPQGRERSSCPLSALP